MFVMSRHFIAAAATVAFLLFLPSASSAMPQFARKYRVDCSYCHAGPPRLNERGLRFIADGYRLERESYPTVPAAVWNTFDGDWRHSAGFSKAFPSKIEPISFGSLAFGPLRATRASYFVEWRALSQSLGGNGRLLNRSGRFEDLFLRLPVSPGGSFVLTAGQFRTLAQVDVSLRLSLSEPMVFSSSVPGPVRARSTRLTSLRGFSASGRQPALRLEYQPGRASSPADGWFAAATLPFSGELTVPLTRAASFELESRPKGIFLETFRRSGLTTVGGHLFVGDGSRRIATLVASHQMGRRLVLVGGIGTFRATGRTDARFSVGGELDAFRQAVVAGVRVDHRTGQGSDPAVLLYGNVHVPFGPRAFRQALKLQIEQRVQPRSHATAVALSHIF